MLNFPFRCFLIQYMQSASTHTVCKISYSHALCVYGIKFSDFKSGSRIFRLRVYLDDPLTEDLVICVLEHSPSVPYLEKREGRERERERERERDEGAQMQSHRTQQPPITVPLPPFLAKHRC